VIISNYRKGVMDRLEFGFQSCLELNPKIIYCTISAFGQKGAYSDHPASDTIIQALSGIMESIGETEGPPLRVSFPLIDLYAASLAAQGIMLALYARQQGKMGLWVDVNLLNTAMVLQCQALAEFLTNGELPKRCGNQNPALSPAGAFQTKDGKYISIAVLREARWKKFCAALGCSEMFIDERFKDNDRRLINRGSLNKILIPIFLTKTQEEWISALSREDILCGPINTFLDVFTKPGLCESISLLEFELMGKKVRTGGNPIEINGEYASVEKTSCLKGEHTNEILKELNFGQNEIEAMVNEGITYQR
jgi:crotonobetainyl-CoA:carnitine CoA-transferase CaiB-like acyl-CoA transferase